tara:strand:+ start:203 stop:379 length:177 start_codon:yes stop_codon:yes gene_type:complete
MDMEEIRIGGLNMDLTPKKAGYIRFLELIAKESVSQVDREYAIDQLVQMANGATYNGE